MPTDLTSYLASRYLTAEAKPSKKRKRKHNIPGGEGLLITDDDDFGGASRCGDDGDYGDVLMGGAATVAGTSSEFRKAKKSNWKTVGGDSNKNNNNTATGASESAEADAIISAAAAETAAAQAAEDEAPVVAGGDVDGQLGGAKSPPVLMSDGTHAGLQSAASVTAQLEKRRREEREQYERERKERRERRKHEKAERAQRGEGNDHGAERSDEEEEEVVYRDATGRRVDIALRRQEARQAALDAEKKEREAKEALRGDVQREEARSRREQLADAALMPLARRADDEEMNRELKEQARWNDPMAAFLSGKKAPVVGGSGSKAEALRPSKSNRPTYRGPAPPNRYGIKPGYRWDGVDRSIGFEAERFKAINRRERNRALEYEWQMDV